MFVFNKNTDLSSHDQHENEYYKCKTENIVSTQDTQVIEILNSGNRLAYLNPLTRNIHVQSVIKP